MKKQKKAIKVLRKHNKFFTSEENVLLANAIEYYVKNHLEYTTDSFCEINGINKNAFGIINDKACTFTDWRK